MNEASFYRTCTAAVRASHRRRQPGSPVAGNVQSGMETDTRAARYRRIQLGLGAANVAVGVAWLVTLVVVHFGRTLDAVAAGIGGAWWWRVAFVAGAVGAGRALLGVPFGWVRGYVLPRRFGLLHQPVSSWIGDRLKAAALGAMLGLALVETTYALLRATSLWWLYGAALVSIVSIVIAVVFPIWIVPLFYRGRRLDDPALRERVVALARRAGITIVDAWVLDQSRKSRTANAALTGLGRTRRIILFDTLVTQFPPDEIEVILAHELGHHVHRDVWRGLALHSMLSLIAFGVAAVVLGRTMGRLGLEGPGDPAGLPWLALVLGAVGFATVPVVNLVSRIFERQADDFALATTGDVDAFVGAMERLAVLNLAERRPPRLLEILLHSHPSIEQRIAHARRRPTPVPAH
jgi:Zn-dependent protease with chaperone function